MGHNVLPRVSPLSSTAQQAPMNNITVNNITADANVINACEQEWNLSNIYYLL